MSKAGDLEFFRLNKVGDCQRCGLCQGRQNIVFGGGNAEAEIMLVGEGPGEQEDRHGQPFVGSSGGILNTLLSELGLEREELYIANIVKCRPPENRDPEPDEIAACLKILAAQVYIIKPRIILALGRVAGGALTNRSTQMWRLREQSGVFLYHKDLRVPVFSTYHPSYILRQERSGDPYIRDKVLGDLRFALNHPGVA